MISEEVVFNENGVPGIYVSLRELKNMEDRIDELKVQLRCGASALESWMECLGFDDEEISGTRKLIADMRNEAE